MGRPGLSQNRKFRRLSLLLGGAPIARGYLELMWDSAYEAGDEVLGDSLDVELAAQWSGKQGELTDALVQTGFLDDHQGVFWIHDFWHHAPAYVRKRRQREDERRTKSDPCPHSDQTVTSQRLDTDEKTAPLPHPHPHLKDNPLPPSGAGTPPAEAGDGKAKRKPKWTKAFPTEIVEAVKAIRSIWPTPEGGEYQPDGRTLVPGVSPSELASNLNEILGQGAEMTVCVAIAERAVREWKQGKWIKAPQYFFGKSRDAPFRAYYQAHVTNQSIRQTALPLDPAS